MLSEARWLLLYRGGLQPKKMTPLDETSSGGLVEVIRGADGKLRKYVRLVDANIAARRVASGSTDNSAS